MTDLIRSSALFILCLACVAASLSTAQAQTAARIVHDGRFDDWAGIAPVATDPADQPAGAVDLRALSVTNDERRLRLRLTFDDVVQLQEGNDLTLYIDTDANAATGRPVLGIGAEVAFVFGARFGTVIVGGTEIGVGHAPLRISWAPTFAAAAFEVELDLDAEVGGAPVFPGDDIVLALSTGSGEQLPQDPGGVAYTIDRATTLPPYDGPTLDAPADAVRVLSYNVLRDNVFGGEARAAFGRIARALAPDVIAFQEIYDNSGADAAALVTEALGGTWFSGDAGSDNLIVSRWPITLERDLGGNSAFLVETPADWSHDLLVVNAHTPCCGNEAGRRDETDRYMQFLRQVQQGAVAGIDADTPFAIVGDLNMVGTDRPLRTMLTGDLVDNATYGPDFAPDLDGTDLTDALPLVLDVPAAFTWYNPSSNFPAGRLDFVVYTDSALELANAFVLFTPDLGAERLETAGLLATDTDVASDHLPVVADLASLRSTASAGEAPGGFAVQAAPTPFTGRTTLRIELPRAGAVAVEVVDALGRRVAGWAGDLTAGAHHLPVDGTAWAPGLYLVRVTTADGTAVGSMVRR